MSSWTCVVCNRTLKSSSKNNHLKTKLHQNNINPNKISENIGSGARQQHGFDFESEIITKFGLTKSTSYTAEYDAFEHDQTPVSVKYIKQNSSIDLGDYFRNADKKCNFILYLGIWKYENNKKKNLIRYKFEIDYLKWNQMFYFEHSLSMKTELKHITNLRSDDANWKSYCSKYQKLWKQEPRKCSLHFKRDHKSQKRIQCGISILNLKRYFRFTII
jgi:hypothetical protein